MGRYAQLVIGPAGSGKSTYCNSVHQHCEIIRRTVHVVNLDPAAEDFNYPVSFDIRDLVPLEDVMDEMKLGPNGGLLYCMEYLEENLDEWLGEELAGYGEEDYLIFDCPGQIELYSHVSAFKSLVDWLKAQGWAVCVVYCLDSQFVSEVSKFVAGSLQAMSAMVLLELPHLNVLTKVDLLTPDSKKALEQFLHPETRLLLDELQASTGSRFRKLNEAISQLIDDWSMISFSPLDYSEEDSIAYVLSQVDTAIQFGEDAEVKVRDGDDWDQNDDDGDDGHGGFGV